MATKLRPSINYTPELIDEAIREHIEKHMAFKGKIEVEYMHRRKTRRVSAVVFLEADTTYKPIFLDDIPIDPSVNIMEVDDLDNISGVDYIDEAPVEFYGLPVHEQEEATGADDQVDLFETSEAFETFEVQAEALRKESREADSELLQEKEASDLKSLFGDN